MLIKGITVQLSVLTDNGVDDFRRPVYTETWVNVENVLIQPVGEQPINDAVNMTGRKATYQLAIPKGDTHVWENRKVQFWGKTFKAVGAEIQGQEELLPLDWNKKISVELING